MPTPSRELLIVAPERWDEACFSVPAVRALAGSGLGIGVLCRSGQQAFWETLPTLPVRTPESLEEGWQVALLWEAGDLAKLVRKRGILKRLGPEGASGGKLAKQLTETLKDSPHPTQHRVQFYLKAVEEMGVETAVPEHFSPAHVAVEPSPTKVLLSPDSDFGSSHGWPLEKWRKLCEQLLEKNPAWDITCTDDGGPLEIAIRKEFGERIGAEAFDLREPDLTLLSQHSLVIAADGSLPHLASHMGATCITLFGPNDAHWKRPLGKRHQVVRQHVECAPCLSAKCPLDLRCQNELEVQKVMTAVSTASS